MTTPSEMELAQAHLDRCVADYDEALAALTQARNSADTQNAIDEAASTVLKHQQHVTDAWEHINQIERAQR